MGSLGQVSTALPWACSTSSLLPAPAPAFHSSSNPLKGVGSLFQQPPGHCIPSSNPNKYVGVWWVFFLTGRPRTSECGFWFQVFPTFWPTLLSPTALGSPASLQLSLFAKPWLWLGNRRLHAALLGCHPLWVPWISQQECFKKAKPSFFHQRGKIYTTLSWLCPSENTPGLLRGWSLGSKCAPNRTSEVKSFCLSIPPCLPQGRWGRMPCRLRCRSGIWPTIITHINGNWTHIKMNKKTSKWP